MLAALVAVTTLTSVHTVLAAVTARLVAPSSRTSRRAGVVRAATPSSVGVTVFLAEVVALLAPDTAVLAAPTALVVAHDILDAVPGLLGESLVVAVGLRAVPAVMVMVVMVVLVGLSLLSAIGVTASVVTVGPTLVFGVATFVHPADVGFLAASLVVIRICHLNSPV